MGIEALNCQCCGAPLKVIGSICECEYCGSTNIVCGESAQFVNMINRANKLRQNCEFDRAFRVYDEILSQSITSADILWAQVLCDYGIEYVLDPSTNKYIPTLHRVKEESILCSKTYLEALECADATQKEKMISSAEEISKIQEEYLNIAANEKPYDVFICYKETDDDTQLQTEDSGLALELYERLESYGYNVFFSRVTLQDKLGINYEPYIFAAIKSALVMVVIGTREEYFNATWVKNEWGRFLKLKENDISKQMYFACDNIDDLPRLFSQRQAQLLTDPNAIQNLAYNIKSYLAKTKDNNTSKPLVSAICPNCKANIEIDTTKEAAICPKCNSAYIVKEAVSSLYKANFQNAIDDKIKSAEMLMKSGDYEKAIAILEEVIKGDNENLVAKEMMRFLYLARAKHSHTSEQVISLLTKALDCDVDDNHYLITDYLCYMGSVSEQIVAYPTNISTIKGFIKDLKEGDNIKIACIEQAFAYYSKAHELHPENKEITLAYNRLHFLLNDYTYAKTADSRTCCELKAYGLNVTKGLFKKTTTFYPLKDIEGIYNGIKLLMKDKSWVRFEILDETQKFSPIANRAREGILPRPHYNELYRKHLIEHNVEGNALTGNYKFVTYYNYNILSNTLNKLSGFY